MARDFDWYSDENSADIAVPAVQAVAVYVNKAGNIVIRQQDSMGDDDSVIVIPRTHADALIAAIKAAATDE